MNIINFLIVFAVGSLWGFLELLIRYNRNLKSIFITAKKWGRKKHTTNDKWMNDVLPTLPYTLLYIFINGLFSLIALFVIYVFSDNKPPVEMIDWHNIFIAGTGSVILLRTTFFSIAQNNNNNIDCGFSVVPQTILAAIDKKINHNIAAKRVCDIHEIMQGLNFDEVQQELPKLCIAFIDNFTDSDSKLLAAEINSIKNEFNNYTKLMLLGEAITKYCDIEILKRVVDRLKSNSKESKGNQPSTNDEFDNLIEKIQNIK